MDNYFGYVTEQFVDVDEQTEFYNNPTENIFGLLTNQYVILKNDKGDVIDKMKWDGEKYVKITYRQIRTDFDKTAIKPRNEQQELVFDLLQDRKTTVKVIEGKFGAGKDLLMASTAAYLIEKGKFDKIVWVRNNVEVKDSNPIGFLPGEKEDKLLPYAMPLADHVGGVDGLEQMIRDNHLELQHLGCVRGRSIKNAIVICSETENLTREHAQLLISRIDEGSEIWFNGDFCQIDNKAFERDNGLKALIERLKGQELFGYVHLEKTERSATAALADLLN